MQTTVAENEGTDPVRIEGELVAQDKTHVVVVSCGTSRIERGLLDERVVRDVAIDSGAKEPLRAITLIPVEPSHANVVAKRNRNIRWNGNGSDRCVVDGEQALLGKRG